MTIASLQGPPSTARTFVVACTEQGTGQKHDCPSKKIIDSNLRELNALLASQGFASVPLDRSLSMKDGELRTPREIQAGAVTIAFTSSPQATLVEAKVGGKAVARDVYVNLDGPLGEGTAKVDLAGFMPVDPAWVAIQVAEVDGADSGSHTESRTSWRILKLDGTSLRDFSIFAAPACPTDTVAQGGTPPLNYRMWCESADGSQLGPERQWHRTGSLAMVANYSKSGLDGEFKTFSEEGKVLAAGHYSNGQRDGEWTENGTTALYAGGMRTPCTVPSSTFKTEEQGHRSIAYCVVGERRHGAYRISPRDGFFVGTVDEEGHYCEGNPCGPWKELYADGSVAATGSYDVGDAQVVKECFKRGGRVKMQCPAGKDERRLWRMFQNTKNAAVSDPLVSTIVGRVTPVIRSKCRLISQNLALTASFQKRCPYKESTTNGGEVVLRQSCSSQQVKAYEQQLSRTALAIRTEEAKVRGVWNSQCLSLDPGLGALCIDYISRYDDCLCPRHSTELDENTRVLSQPWSKGPCDILKE